MRVLVQHGHSRIVEPTTVRETRQHGWARSANRYSLGNKRTGLTHCADANSVNGAEFGTVERHDHADTVEEVKTLSVPQSQPTQQALLLTFRHKYLW